MDILKLIIVFAVIIGVMWMKKPMWMAVIAASIATVLLYGLSPQVTAGAVYKGATAKATIQTLVVFYSITFLQRMMEKRKNLSNAQLAMNGLFNNNRVNASIVPFLLGMLPAASTVLIWGPIVRESVKGSDLTVCCRLGVLPAPGSERYRHGARSAQKLLLETAGSEYMGDCSHHCIDPGV